jgi:hypothetical protein
MKVGEKKPYIPIFVGSTFTDMQLYRRAVRDALAQLETVVRGMEQFGSKPGGPVDECLRIVSSCNVYVGLFGMRYGTVPEGHEKSMTHLEYDEAQRCKMPSLIYVVDEENQPVLPRDIEFGPGADKLALLKAELKKRHVVSFFTTAEDLRARILHDVLDLLRNIGAEVSGELVFDSAQSDAEVLKSFELLPKMFSGRSVTVQFKTQQAFRSAYPEACWALGLEIGATIVDRLQVNNGASMQIFAERNTALKLCQALKGSTITATAVTAFGTYNQPCFVDDEIVLTRETELGLLVKDICALKRISDTDTIVR